MRNQHAELGDCVAVRITHDEEYSHRVINGVQETLGTPVPEFYFATSLEAVRRFFDDSRINYRSIDVVALDEVPGRGIFTNSD
jgi:hypothetical protein